MRKVHATAVLLLAISALFGALAIAGDRPAAPAPQRDVVQAMLDRSRLLADVHFQVPVAFYEHYLREREGPVPAQASVAYIIERAEYHFAVAADRTAVLNAELRVRVFDPAGMGNLPVLWGKASWEKITINGKSADATLPTAKGWRRFSVETPGEYVIAARAPLDRFKFNGRVRLPIRHSVRTIATFDSPSAWTVSLDRSGQATGSAEKGTHTRFHLPVADALDLSYGPPEIRKRHPTRYEVSGDVAWNQEAGVQQVAAALKVTIAGGAADRVVLRLPAGADRVRVTGSDVRQVDVSAGRATVYLRGDILGPVALNIAYDYPTGSGDRRDFGLTVVGGHWTGGTLVVTNPAASSEVLPVSTRGLSEIALADVPDSAAALCPSPPVLAYTISGRDFSVAVEILKLGEFALQEAVADLAHYELFLSREGELLGRVKYEIRNRHRQFLCVTLPPGAKLLLARVSEKSCPVSLSAEQQGVWRIPLERSRSSVLGLVSFPVEIVYTCRGPSPADGQAEMTLPSIDLPVAYAWCESYVPPEMDVKKWGGALRPVRRFTSETAAASLDYGLAELTKGYEASDRPNRPQAGPQPSQATPRKGGSSSTMWLGKSRPQPVADTSGVLARNYYRAGMDYYDKGDYANARLNLQRTVRLAPKSVEGGNARRALANIDVLSGKDLAESKSQKAAAAKVRRESREKSRLLLGGQHTLIEEGLEDARAGRIEQAKAKLKAAEAMTDQLQSRGITAREQEASLRETRKTLTSLKEADRQRAKELRAAMEQSKADREYDKALTLGRKLRQLEPDNAKLSGEMEELAVAAAEQQAARGRLGVRHSTNQPAEPFLDIRESEIPWQNELQYSNNRPEPLSNAAPATPPAESGKPKPVTRAYDVRDLMVRVPNFEAPNKELGNRANDDVSGGVYADYDVASDRNAAKQEMEEFQKLLTATAESNKWGKDSIRFSDGQLVVTQTEENQRAVAELLNRLRAARGPQVASGGLIITGQRAGGVFFDDTVVKDLESLSLKGTTAGDSVGNAAADKKQYEEFVAKNYGWLQENQSHVEETAGSTATTRPAGEQAVATESGRGDGELQLDEIPIINNAFTNRGLVRDEETPMVQIKPEIIVDSDRDIWTKLEQNLGQVVAVNSLNVNADASAAESLGVTFTIGNNDVRFGLADEGQYRALLELAGGKNDLPVSGRRSQETVVGTDALLSNRWTGNVIYAADDYNRLDIRDNPITLPHEAYLVIDNGRSLTVIRTGEMRHWTDQPAAADVPLADVPQDIAVPRAGRLIRFEKTLLQPTDNMVIRADCEWKGVSR